MSATPGPPPQLVTALRRLRAAPVVRAETRAAAEAEGRCELCPAQLPDTHQHLLHLVERRIVCVCSMCWAIRSGDAEFRPAGGRTLWLNDLEMPEDVWGRFSIPIGLAFFMRSTQTGEVIAMYPSPAGATECELDLDAWSDLVAANPVLETLEPDAEGLIVNRLSDPHTYVLAPIDRCYALVGTVKSAWEGISGGGELERAVAEYFAGMGSGSGT